MIRFIKSHIFGSYDGLRKQDRGISQGCLIIRNYETSGTTYITYRMKINIFLFGL